MNDPKTPWRPGLPPAGTVALLLMLAFPSLAGATWVGKFDLNPVVAPAVFREIHDGQWLYGITKPNLWHLDYQGAADSIWTGQRLHVGAYQAWNAESGNASFGPIAGVDIPLNVSAGLGAVGNALGLPAFFKPAQYLSSMISLDGFGGYRPKHTADVIGNWVYGVSAQLKIAFGVRELEKGL